MDDRPVRSVEDLRERMADVNRDCCDHAKQLRLERNRYRAALREIAKRLREWRGYQSEADALAVITKEALNG